METTKGFLTAEERDQMAMAIQQTYPPLPPITMAATPMVTRAGEGSQEVTPQPSASTVVTTAPVVTVAAVVTAAAVIMTNTTTTPVTTSATVVTSVIVTATASPCDYRSQYCCHLQCGQCSHGLAPQVGAVAMIQQQVVPVSGTVLTRPTVTTGEMVTPSQSCRNVVTWPCTATPLISGVFLAAFQSQPFSGTSIVPSKSKCPLSHPIVIKPMSKKPCTGIIVGFEALTIPSDLNTTVTATVSRMVAPINPHSLLQGLASHQAVGAASRLEAGVQATVIGTIHGPGPTDHYHSSRYCQA